MLYLKKTVVEGNASKCGPKITHSIDLAFDRIVFKITVRSFSGFYTLENLVESRR